MLGLNSPASIIGWVCVQPDFLSAVEQPVEKLLPKPHPGFESQELLQSVSVIDTVAHMEL